MDVVAAAWAAAGQPQPEGPRTGRGPCARCGQEDDLTPAAAVVSSKYTGWEQWANPGGRGTCAACTWAHRAPGLRARPALITRSPLRLAWPALPELADLLTRTLPPGSALTVPLRPGRKHLLPGAPWGRISTGEAQLTWSGDDAARLRALRRLRASGFGSHMVAEAAPPYPALRRLAPGHRAVVLQDWKALTPWRQRRPWLNLAVRITVPAAAAQ